MESKLWFLTKRSLKNKINTKWFKIINILLIVAIIGLLNIDHVIKSFGGDFNKESKILVIDNTKRFYNELEDNYNVLKKQTGNLINNEITLYEKDEESAYKEVDENEFVLLIINDNKENLIEAKLVTQNGVDVLLSQILNQAINSTKVNIAMNETKIDMNELNKIYQEVNVIEEKTSDSDKLNSDQTMNMIMSTVFPIFILPFFMLAIFVVQFVGTEVNEEKTTKSMAIILTNVSAKTHLFSKIIANNIFVILQGLILIVSLALGIWIRTLLSGGSLSADLQSILGSTFEVIKGTGILSNLPTLIPLVLILMVLTFIAFSLLAGILASMTTSMEEYQQVNLPTMLILMAGYYLSMMAGMFPGAVFIRALSYVPFISAILSPAILIMGQISVVDVIISILIMIGTIMIMYYYGLKIYKIGILNYSSGNVFKKLAKALKNK